MSQVTIKGFEIYNVTDHLLVRTTGILSPQSCALLLENLNEICDPPLNIVLDCASLNTISAPAIRSLVQIEKKLKAANKQIRLINLKPDIIRFLKQEGVDRALKPSLTLRAALTDMGGAESPRIVDVDFINPFLNSTISVLEVQASTKAVAGKVYKRGQVENYLGDVSGVIGLVSDSFSGSVVISFPGPTFLQIMSRMLGEECKELNKEIADGAGELTNIIFGQAKVGLNEKGFGIKTALPSVVSGSDHSILHLSKGPHIVIPFQSDAGEFYVEICLSA